MISNRDNIVVDDQSRKELDPTALFELAATYKEKPATSGINFNYNHIGNDGMEAIANIILNCPSLRILKLQYNSIGDKGIEKLLQVEGVKELLPKLDLQLANNEISEKGLLLIKDFLSPDSVLNILFGNQIWDENVREMCRTDAVKAKQEKVSTSQSIHTQFKVSKDKYTIYRQEPSRQFSIYKFLVDFSQDQCALVITVKDRKTADSFTSVFCSVIRMSRFDGRKGFEFSPIVCEELGDSEKARVNEKDKPLYRKPYKMVRITGKVMQALDLLKDEINHDVLAAIKNDIKNFEAESEEKNEASDDEIIMPRFHME